MLWGDGKVTRALALGVQQRAQRAQSVLGRRSCRFMGRWEVAAIGGAMKPIQPGSGGAEDRRSGQYLQANMEKRFSSKTQPGGCLNGIVARCMEKCNYLIAHFRYLMDRRPMAASHPGPRILGRLRRYTGGHV